MLTRYENLTDYEKSWEKYKPDSPEMKKMNEAMEGYLDMYISGSREIYQVW
jgi:hypothetical protein